MDRRAHNRDDDDDDDVFDPADVVMERDVLLDPLEAWVWLRARSTADCLVAVTLAVTLLCGAASMGIGAYKLLQ